MSIVTFILNICTGTILWKALGDYTITYYWPGYHKSHADVDVGYQSREWFWFPAKVYIPPSDSDITLVIAAYVNDVDQADIAIDDIAITVSASSAGNFF